MLIIHLRQTERVRTLPSTLDSVERISILDNASQAINNTSLHGS